MSDDELLAAFENCSLPFELWNHAAHVRIGFVYASRYRLDDAIDRMRAGIKLYNAAHNVKDGPLMGYHETMTQAFMRLIRHAIHKQGPFQSSEEFNARCSRLLDRRVLLRYYTRDRIMHPSAKTSFVEPDIAPLHPIEGQ